MPLKKQTFNADEIEIYDEAVVYKRGEYWQMRMWLGVRTLMALSGHSNMATTQRYIDLRPAVIKAAVELF
jgi:hypothetical protein